MKVKEGTSIKTLIEVKGDGDTLREGAVLTISDPNYFGIGLHLAYDGNGTAWAIDESSIDSKNPETNDFTVIGQLNVKI